MSHNSSLKIYNICCGFVWFPVLILISPYHADFFGFAADQKKKQDLPDHMALFLTLH